MAIRRSSNRRGTPQRRKLVWARTTPTAPTFTAAGTTVLIPLLSRFETVYGADPVGTTVMRIRAKLSFRSSTAGNQIRTVAAIGVLPAGVTAATVSPASQEHLDWMYWQTFHYEPVIATEFATINMWDVDVRAKRKMEELNQTLFLVIGNWHSADTVNYSYSASTLLALP